MSAGYDTASPRFFRPNDVARIRRNQRRIQVQRVAAIGGRAAVVIVLIAGALATYRHTQQDARFAVKTIEVTGATHVPKAALAEITRRYVGTNLFRVDIAAVQRDFRRVGWISRIEAEKKLPDTLRIHVVERTPVALVLSPTASPAAISYVDEQGVAFADLTPSVGDGDLPLITNASGADLVRAVALVRTLHARDPQIYARISEVRPVAPDGFALFDRELGAFIYTTDADLSSKWRELYAITQAERLGAHDIAYADLRFAGRVVIKPVHASVLAPVAAPQPISSQITN
jgi:cell division septal protein FtsQ